jgi:hypothetical protein
VIHVNHNDFILYSVQDHNAISDKSVTMHQNDLIMSILIMWRFDQTVQSFMRLKCLTYYIIVIIDL